MPTLLSTLDPLLRDLYHQLHPVSHHLIHHHSKYGGRERVSLRHYTRSLKRCPVVSARPFYHRQMHPMCLEEPMGPGDHAVTFQDIQAPGPLQVTLEVYWVSVGVFTCSHWILMPKIFGNSTKLKQINYILCIISYYLICLPDCVFEVATIGGYLWRLQQQRQIFSFSYNLYIVTFIFLLMSLPYF